MTRLERLQARLSSHGYDALVATQRPNQLYYTPHPEPVSGLPPIPFLLLIGREVIAIPGPLFYYAYRDQLTQCAVIKGEIGDPDVQSQLATLLDQRQLRRVAFDQLAPRLAAFLQQQSPATSLVEEARLVPELRRPKEPGELDLLRRAAQISDLGMAAAFAAAASATMLKAGCEEVRIQVVSVPGVVYMGTGNWVFDLAAPARPAIWCWWIWVSSITATSVIRRAPSSWAKAHPCSGRSSLRSSGPTGQRGRR
jgi:Xaa-Pro aminopeptidase